MRSRQRFVDAMPWKGRASDRTRGPHPGARVLKNNMWLEATLTKDDLESLLAQFAPLEIRLGESGRLILASPTEVSMNPGKGVGVLCDATVHWPLLGMDLPVRMRGLGILLRPAVRPGSDGSCGVLVFTLQIEHVGVSPLPAVFDASLTSLLNRELAQDRAALVWNFVETLSHVFALPAALASAATLGLKANAGSIRITDKAIGFVVGFGTDVQPRPAAPVPIDTVSQQGAASPG
jgi:hypothetical protein